MSVCFLLPSETLQVGQTAKVAVNSTAHAKQSTDTQLRSKYNNVDEVSKRNSVTKLLSGSQRNAKSSSKKRVHICNRVLTINRVRLSVRLIRNVKLN